MNRPVYNPKFLLIGVPAYCLLLGATVVVAYEIVRRVRLPQLLGYAGSAAVLLAFLYASGRSYVAGVTEPKYFRDDYRGIVRYINASVRPGDAIVLNAPGQREIFEYYYKDEYPLIGLPTQRPPDDARTEREVVGLTSTVKRVWLVLWAAEQADPNEIVRSTFDRDAFRTQDRWFGGVQLVLYTMPSAAGNEPQFAEEARFSNGITLLGYSLAQRAASAGDSLQLTLYWKTEKPVEERFTVFAHVIDDKGELVWGQRDSEPGSGQRPTTSWQPGEVIIDRYGIPINPGTPPADYLVEIGLYRPTDGTRLGVLDGRGVASSDRVLYPGISVQRPTNPPAAEAIVIRDRRTDTFGALRLIGSEVHRLGAEATAITVAPSGLVQATLVGRVERAGYDAPFVVEFRDGTNVAARYEGDPTLGLYPASRWQPGEVLRLQHKFAAPTQPGRYRVFAGFRGETLIDIGQIEVR